MHAFSGRFSRASLEGISFNFFVCFIFNISIGSAPKRKNIDIQYLSRFRMPVYFKSIFMSSYAIATQENFKIPKTTVTDFA